MNGWLSLAEKLRWLEEAARLAQRLSGRAGASPPDRLRQATRLRLPRTTGGKLRRGRAEVRLIVERRRTADMATAGSASPGKARSVRFYDEVRSTAADGVQPAASSSPCFSSAAAMASAHVENRWWENHSELKRKTRFQPAPAQSSTEQSIRASSLCIDHSGCSVAGGLWLAVRGRH